MSAPRPPKRPGQGRHIVTGPGGAHYAPGRVAQRSLRGAALWPALGKAVVARGRLRLRSPGRPKVACGACTTPPDPRWSGRIAFFYLAQKAKNVSVRYFPKFAKLARAFRPPKGSARGTCEYPCRQGVSGGESTRAGMEPTKTQNAVILQTPFSHSIRTFRPPNLTHPDRHGGALWGAGLDLFQGHHVHLPAHPDGGKRSGIDPWTNNHQRIHFGSGPRRGPRWMPGTYSCSLTRWKVAPLVRDHSAKVGLLRRLCQDSS